jgi:hypothetical protein
MTKQRQKVLPKYDFDVEIDKQIDEMKQRSNKHHIDLLARIDKMMIDLQMISTYITTNITHTKN